MSEKLASITSIGSRLDAKDHEVDLAAVTSNPVSLSEVAAGLTNDQKYIVLRRLNYEGLVSLNDLPVGALFMVEKINALQIPEAVDILKETIEAHDGDINYPTQDYDFIQKLVAEAPSDFHNSQMIKNLELASASEDKKKEIISNTIEFDSEDEHFDINFHEIFDWEFQVKMEAAIIAYYSPYPEVRAVTDPYDDPSIPCETIRAYIVAIVWSGVGAFINQFFSERNPGIGFSGSIAYIFIYPSGLLLEYIIPKFSFKIFKQTIDLNPGPWTYKEQMFASLIFSFGGGTNYVAYNIISQKLPHFYNNQWVTWGYQIILTLSTNFLGFGFSGLLRKFVVYPVQAVWPLNLPSLALNRALVSPEKKEIINGWKISKYYTFCGFFVISFLWYWVPNVLFTALSYFNWMTWIAPDNFNLATITGSITGLGINPISTFDWNYISFNGPMYTPFYTYMNTYIGVVLSFFCIVAVYYSNNNWTAYIPINSNLLFSNTGDNYDVNLILNDIGEFDQAKYDLYGPPFYTAGNLITYGAFFALYPFAIVYEVGTSWKSYGFALKRCWKSIRNWRHNQGVYDGYNDPQCRMMSQYKEVPDYYFLIILLISLVLAIVCVEIYPVDTPVWAIFFALAINFVFLIPIATITATTGFSYGLNVLVELIIGYALPGNPQALMLIKAFGYNIDGQADSYVSNLKLGHYAKIPPRALFRGQILGLFLSSFVGLAVVNFQLTIENFCMPHQKQKFTCPNSSTFFTASVIWGTIGPKRVFDGLYPVLKYCFLIGAVSPLFFIAIKYYFPRHTKYLHPTIILGGFLAWAPYNLSYYTPGLYVSIAFMYYVRKHYITWWEKYNYIISSGLNAGLAFSAIIVFFAVQYNPKNIQWWGNDVPFSGLDAIGVSLKNATIDAPDGYFGPRIGHFP